MRPGLDPVWPLALILSAAAGMAAADRAFVTCQTGDALSVIDLDDGVERARWSIPGKPAGVAASAQAVFTVSPDSKTIRRLDPSTGDVLAETALDGGPIGTVLDHDRNRLFVSDWYNARLWVLDATTLELITELPSGAEPAGLSLSPDGRFVAVADKGADQVSIFDAETLTPLRTAPVGTRPFGLSFGPDGRLYVGNVGSDDLTVLDPATGQTIATIPVGDRPYGVAFAKGRAFVTNQYENTVSVINMDSLTHETKIDVGEYPEGIDATEDGARIVLANWFDNTVTIIDAASLNVLNTVETCDGPRAFGAFVLGGEK